MSNIQEQLKSVLTDLKYNYNIIGVKAEFEDEGATEDEVIALKNLSSECGLNFTLKVGGCAAIKDMNDAKRFGIKRIVAPMIETPYSLYKFVESFNRVFDSSDRADMGFYINIETITGYNNFEDIINSEYFDQIEGVIVGRSDMTKSLGLTKDFVNSGALMNIAYNISNKIKSKGKKFVIGGNVSSKSLDFFKNLPYITGFETRKIIFDSSLINSNKCEEGILKALKFEILWLQSKREQYDIMSKDDLVRINHLEETYRDILSALANNER
ncbi:citrate lyase beta subunit [bacterium]|nr:citrate lyase beta subunit [bacterium]